MNIAKYIAFAVLTLVLQISTANAAPVTTSSILIDAQSGSVLYADNADAQRYPASLTKLMTLYITFNALENHALKLDDQLKISHTAANRSPSRLGLTPGKTIDVRTAILGTIVKSANDCATVLGEALAKDERSFAVLMTQTARSLGMKNTTFKNASGLPNSQQKTTARDMAILATALYHHFPQYYAWFSIPEFEYDGKTYTTHNFLLKDFAGADGMKTGYTAASGFNIVTSARRGNHRVIAVTMGHQQQEVRDKKVYAMMDQALNKMEKSSKIDSRRLKAAIDRAAPQTKNTKYASAARAIKDSGSGVFTPKSAKQGNWAIQTGAFGSYAKAQNVAEKVKNKLSGKFAMKGINVEKFSRSGVTMYRSQVTGFAKSEAGRACNLLKSRGQSCIVTAYVSPNKAYAQR